MSDVRASKFLSLVLRHKPQAAGLTLDAEGWAEVDAVLAATDRIRDRAHLEHVVATNDKKRFVLSEDRRLIRAAQGHSVDVNLGFQPAIPPDQLFHGTATKSIDAILDQGLKPRGRQYVHLSATHEVAVNVGKRHGTPVVLIVDAKRAHGEDQLFFQAENGVWLTPPLEATYLTFPE
ncbi:MAG: RNA 2'-phosphotransferase [Silicimonas sp.]|nr:RNA 2'-phosphotransferase [Silicimonas sp.]